MVATTSHARPQPQTAPGDAVLSAVSVSRTFGRGQAETQVLDDVSLDIRRGEFVAMVGPSGSGKSTLLNLLGLLDRPTSGEIVIAGEPAASRSASELATLRNRHLGFVFQSYNLLAGLTAIENVLLPAVLAGTARSARQRADQLLSRVELDGLADRYPSQLSGGQQQRVAIARALVLEPEILLADEPTGNLDSRSSAVVLDLLRELHAGGQTVVMVTHDNDAAEASPRLVSLRDGRVVGDRIAT